jgi:hypothetical protein
MNRIVTLRLITLGRLTSRRPSSIRRAGFYAADMSVKIIFEVIVRRCLREPQPESAPKKPRMKYGLTAKLVMAGLAPVIHDFGSPGQERRGCRTSPAMTEVPDA